MRAVITEYGAGIELSTLVDDNHPIHVLSEHVSDLNSRLKNTLHIDSDVVSIHNGRLRAYRIAGVVSLCPEIELEIVPKFLDQSSDWKETFFFLSLISKHGVILDGRSIGSDKSFLESFYEVAGIMLADDYLRLRRKPIRQYRKRMFRDHVWEGDVDLESLCERHMSGPLQSENVFTVHNEFNSTIVKAMELIFPYVHDSKARSVLRHVLTTYGPCEDYSRTRKSMPRRNKEWDEIYNLSYDIITGMTLGLEEGHLHSHEFIINTWQMWEWLVSIGMSVGSRSLIVRAHTTYDWGVKIKGGKSSKLVINPDISIFSRNSQKPIFLIDAKYKDAGSDVDRSDIYEALAFCKGTDTDNIVLVYPVNATDSPCGTVKLQSYYKIENISVLQASVTFGDMTSHKGLGCFGRSLAEGIERILDETNSHL